MATRGTKHKRINVTENRMKLTIFDFENKTMTPSKSSKLMYQPDLGTGL